jgi:tetratricopeptide (TPR) repeat protein
MATMSSNILSWVGALILVAGFATAQRVKSEKELDAFKAIENEKDPDQIVKKVEEFLIKYADTELKSLALNFAADAEQRKGDPAKAIDYAQTALDSDPQDYQAMLLISGELAQQTREDDTGREGKLALSEKLAQAAIATIQATPKPNEQLPDEQWTNYKKDLISRAHEDLGIAALASRNPRVAVAEFKLAVEVAATPDAGTMVRLAAAYNQSGHPDDAIAVCTKVLGVADLHPAVKKLAEREKARAEALKSGKP